MKRSYTLNNSLLCFSFNQNCSCFCIGTEKGFTVYKSAPLNDHYTRELNGGIGLISMFNNSNILALVGGGKRPYSALNKLIIWNDATAKQLFEIEVESKILNLKIKNSLFIIVMKRKIKLYYYDSLENILNYKNIDTIDTIDNKSGILGFNLNPNHTVISYISKNIGEIIIKIYDKFNINEDIKFKTKKIPAHQSEVTYMALNYLGDILASCSEKGTIIRLFSTKTGHLLKELRRGTDYAEIYSLNFDKNSRYLICGSSKGTIHVFNIKENEGVKNPKSFLSSIGSYLNIQYDYLNNEWSFAQFHIESKGKYITNFVGDNNIFIILTNEGLYYRVQFKPTPGEECKILQKDQYLFIEAKDDDFLF